MTLKDEKISALERKEVTVYPPSLEFMELGEVQPLRNAVYLAEHSVAGIIAKRGEMENRGMCALKQTALVEHVFRHSKKKKV